MPALPRQGTNVDEEDEDEDEEDDDGDDTEDGEDFVEASDGGDDDDDDRTAEDSPTTRDRLALASPSRQHERVQVLAPSLHLPIDLTRLDLTFLDDPPRSPDMKGKGKQREDSDLLPPRLPRPGLKAFQLLDSSLSPTTTFLSQPLLVQQRRHPVPPHLHHAWRTACRLPGSPLARGHMG